MVPKSAHALLCNPQYAVFARVLLLLRTWPQHTTIHWQNCDWRVHVFKQHKKETKAACVDYRYHYNTYTLRALRIDLSMPVVLSFGASISGFCNTSVYLAVHRAFLNRPEISLYLFKYQITFNTNFCHFHLFNLFIMWIIRVSFFLSILQHDPWYLFTSPFICVDHRISEF